MKKLLQTAADAWLLLLTFLLPLKFGIFAVMPETGALFPGDVFSYLVINWASTAFGLLTGPALLLCLAAFPAAGGQYRAPAWGFALLWSLGLVLGALPGLCRVSSLDFAVLQLNHFGAVGSYALAVYLAAAWRETCRKRLTAALAAGFLLTIWFGIEQYFWGFARSRAFLEQQMAEGVAVGEVMQARTADDRVFSTFTSCNSLAGYLLLLTPFLTVCAWRLGRKVEPARISQWLFAVITGGSALAVFLLTKSRAGYLALALTAGLALLCLPMKRWKKGVLLAGIGCMILGSAWYIHAHGRGFLSMTARADYLRSSAILLGSFPVTGCGWGEFFYEHPRIKLVRDKEAAHDPHNLLATQAQAGLGAVLIALAGLGLPYLAGFRRWKKQGTLSGEDRAVLFGMTAFIIHAMMDIDLQIPGLMASYIALGTLFLCREMPDAVPLPRQKQAGYGILCAGLLLAGWTVYSSCRELHGEIQLENLQKLTHLQYLTPEERQKVTPELVDRAFLAAKAARPYSSQPWSAAGNYYLNIGDIDRADYMYAEALKLAPKRAALYAARGKIARIRGDHEQAVELFRKAAALFPHHPGYRGLLRGQ